ncbi:MAG: CopG family transcriptional regulator [Dehalococcoidia bacterium]|nr:CopG family transcriptional regulator [Dehalococcoidia bacterium]
MKKIIIQVPIDNKLLDDLKHESAKQNKTRSELIRLACQQYLKRLQEEELDRLYEEGYKKIPEDTDIGEAQVAMLSEVIKPEDW